MEELTKEEAIARGMHVAPTMVINGKDTSTVMRKMASILEEANSTFSAIEILAVLANFVAAHTYYYDRTVPGADPDSVQVLSSIKEHMDQYYDAASTDPDVIDVTVINVVDNPMKD
jgi:hypothetical protein